jgi:reductive dehalogenase
MKGLGLAGASLGAAAATTPVFHDLDEVTSVPQGETKHPWYVSKLDHEKPTVEIDWSILQRMGDRGTRTTPFISRFYGSHPDKTAAGDRAAGGRHIQYMQEKFPDYQGPSVRDRALTGAGGATRLPQFGGYDAEGFMGLIPQPNRIGSTVRAINIPTPDTKWTGTPEENLRTLRSAARFFGASEIGCVELTANTKKLIHANDSSGKPYNFGNTTVPEITDSEYIIPNSSKNVFVFGTLEPTSQVRQAPAPTYTGYDPYGRVVARLHYFLGALGYTHIDIGNISASNPFGALSGVAEHSRAGHIVTSYKYGNLVRGMHRIITDFPLAPTNPVDAGVAKFCETCKNCSMACPYDCMDMGEKRWDNWNSGAEQTMNYVPGFKGWRTNIIQCQFCKNCHGTCPFDAGDEALVHTVVRTTLAITPIFNSFFANMHRTFGYLTRNPDDWWESDVPIGFNDPTFTHA